MLQLPGSCGHSLPQASWTGTASTNYISLAWIWRGMQFHRSNNCPKLAYLNLTLQRLDVINYLIKYWCFANNLIRQAEKSFWYLPEGSSGMIKMRKHEWHWMPVEIKVHLVASRHEILENFHPFTYFLASCLSKQALWVMVNLMLYITYSSNTFTVLEQFGLIQWHIYNMVQKYYNRLTLSARLWLSVAWPLLALTWI